MYGISQRVHRSKNWIKRTSSAENLLVKLVQIMVSCDCSLELIRRTTFSKDPGKKRLKERRYMVKRSLVI